MPKNGERNTRLGVYINLCCGLEMVINNGVVFPDCPNHKKLTTVWKPADKGKIHKLARKQTKPGSVA